VLFEWSGVDVDGQESIPASVFASVTNAQFQVPANTLTAGKFYSITCLITMANDPTKSSQATHTVYVDYRDLQPIIAGGNSLRLSSQKNWTLDASGSRDPDVSADADQGLAFTWVCRIQEGFRYNPCRDSSNQVLVLPSQPVLSFFAGDLSSTVVHPYLFYVTISKPDKTRKDFSMPVTIVEEMIPTVSIAKPSSEEGTMQSDGSILLNSNAKLVLQGACDESEGSLQWSFSPALNPPTGSSGTPNW